MKEQKSVIEYIYKKIIKFIQNKIKPVFAQIFLHRRRATVHLQQELVTAANDD